MYYFEKDYIMRLIHGIARILARMFFDSELAEDGGMITVRGAAAGKTDDYLRKLVDEGSINAAENRLFELLESSPWEKKQLAALAVSFYDYVNGKGDDFLAAADFPREEIISGLEEALAAAGMDLPEYLRL